MSLKFSVTFTRKLLSNHTTKLIEVSIKINGMIHFSQIWQIETS